MLSTLLAGSLLLAFPRLPFVAGRQTSRLQESLFPDKFLAENVTHSLNVSTCPGMSGFRALIPGHAGTNSTPTGYTLSGLQQTKTGLLASLNLAGPACNAFGEDIANLTLEVTYDTITRLVFSSEIHVVRMLKMDIDCT